MLSGARGEVTRNGMYNNVGICEVDDDLGVLIHDIQT